MQKGKVLKSTGKWYIVELEDGEIVNCRIRGKLRLDGLRTTNPISVGDVVSVGDEIDGAGDTCRLPMLYVIISETYGLELSVSVIKYF